jgi:AcrR family transcriptional regulator
LPKDSSRARTTRAPKRRQRRSSEEIIDRLIQAACDEFEHNGYAGAKTAAIARKAGVAEALIFSNFGSKAKLFQDAIFKPLNRLFLDFHSTHGVDTTDRQAMEKGARQYIEELQEFIERHSRMLMSLFVAQLYAPDNLGGLSHIQGLHDYFSRATAMATDRLVEPPRIPPRLIARVSFATILACIIFRDLLFPKGLATRDEIRAAISDFLMDGLNANAAPKHDQARRPVKRRPPSRPAVSRSRRV